MAEHDEDIGETRVQMLKRENGETKGDMTASKYDEKSLCSRGQVYREERKLFDVI